MPAGTQPTSRRESGDNQGAGQRSRSASPAGSDDSSTVLGTGVAKTVTVQEKKRKTMLFLKRLAEQGQQVLLDPRDEETLKNNTGVEDIERLTRERILSKKKPRPRDILM